MTQPIQIVMTPTHLKTIWITMYRTMPYCMYYTSCKCLQLLISIKVKVPPVKRYMRQTKDSGAGSEGDS